MVKVLRFLTLEMFVAKFLKIQLNMICFSFKSLYFSCILYLTGKQGRSYASCKKCLCMYCTSLSVCTCTLFYSSHFKVYSHSQEILISSDPFVSYGLKNCTSSLFKCFEKDYKIAQTYP